MPTTTSSVSVVECVRPAVRHSFCLRPEGVDFWNELPWKLFLTCYRTQGGRTIYPRLAFLSLPPQRVALSMTLPQRRRSDERFVFSIEAYDPKATKKQWHIINEQYFERGSCVLLRPVDSATPLSNGAAVSQT